MVEGGVSPVAARQRTTRAQRDYKRLAGLRFAKNARFIYLEEQYGNQRFWAAIERAFKANGKSYFGALTGLKAKGGRCPRSLFASTCGAPISRKGQLSPDRILERLCAINLLEDAQDEGGTEGYIKFKPGFYHVAGSSRANAILLAEFVALQAIKDWARKIGLGSYGKFRVRDEESPVVAGITWDLTAPSYIRPLTSSRDGLLKPGFIVCDINLNGPIDDDQVDLFIRKYGMAVAPANISPVMPFLVGDIFTSSAFDRAKSAGIIAVTISNLFGQDLSRALDDLIKLLSDTGATAAVNPNQLNKVMSQLTKIEGAANNLRGALFELVVGNLVKDKEGGFLSVGVEKTHYPSMAKFEIDVLLDIQEKSVSRVIECKAKIPGAEVSLSDVEKWYSRRIPLIFETLRQEPHYKDKKIEFELWTNGTLHPSAKSWFQSQSSKDKEYSVICREGGEIKKYATGCSRAIRKLLDEHYFRNPLTRLNAQ